MAWYVAGWLGAVGSVLVEAIDLVRLIRQDDEKLPAVVYRAGYWVAVAIRAAIGFVVAAILIGASLITGAAETLGIGEGAVLVLAGAGAPLIVERLLAAFLALVGQSPGGVGGVGGVGGAARSATTPEVTPEATTEVVGRASSGPGFGEDLIRCLVRGDQLFTTAAKRPR